MTQNKIHITPITTYLAVAFGLFILTGITVAASFIDLGGFNVVLALAIASVKALLVALFFMHLLYDNKLYLIVFSAALFFLTLFITLTMFDTNYRGEIYQEQAKPINSEAEIYKQVESK
jgi:cytochrome c oxidase subunit IV